MPESQMTYVDAGVDIDAGERFAQMIQERVAAAWPDATDEIGGFAGGVLIPSGAKEFQAGADGTGTKIILAALLDQFEGIGQDAVAMAAVDTYVSGVQPTAILDVIDVAKLNPDQHIKIIESIIRACKLAGCRLIGGETAELPDLFRSDWMVNINVTCIGFPQEASQTRPRPQIKPDQLVFGWPSYGPASNGFSLLRKVFQLKDGPAKTRQRLQRHNVCLGKTLGDALLHPTPIWIKEIDEVQEKGVVFSGHAHITGGGMVGNIPRILPPNCKVVIDRSKWQRPPIFQLAQARGNINQDEMDRTFNQGVMIASIVSERAELLAGHERAFQIGRVESRRGDEPQVQFQGEFPGE